MKWRQSKHSGKWHLIDSKNYYLCNGAVGNSTKRFTKKELTINNASINDFCKNCSRLRK